MLVDNTNTVVDFGEEVTVGHLSKVTVVDQTAGHGSTFITLVNYLSYGADIPWISTPVAVVIFWSLQKEMCTW